VPPFEICMCLLPSLASPLQDLARLLCMDPPKGSSTTTTTTTTSKRPVDPPTNATTSKRPADPPTNARARPELSRDLARIVRECSQLDSGSVSLAAHLRKIEERQNKEVEYFVRACALRLHASL
jgi:hypothetical protein